MAVDLSNYPSECSKDYVKDTVTITVPYQGYSKSVKVEPFAYAWGNLFKRDGEALSYDSTAEKNYLQRLFDLSRSTRNKAFTTPGADAAAQQAVKSLTEETDRNLGLVEELYAKIAEIQLPIKPVAGATHLGFPLSMREADVERDLTEDAKGSILWRNERDAARAAIRELYRDASRYLWCARIGLAQIESKSQAMQAYEEGVEAAGGMELGGEGSAPSAAGPTFGGALPPTSTAPGPLGTKLGSIVVTPPGGRSIPAPPSGHLPPDAPEGEEEERPPTESAGGGGTILVLGGLLALGLAMRAGK